MTLRTEEEVRAAAEAFAWYVARGPFARQSVATRNSLIVVIACLEWVQGEGAGSSVADTLRSIAEMRAKDGGR
jgi:hypothetical protein